MDDATRVTQRRTGRNGRRTVALGLAGASVALLAACGSSTEQGIEELIESQSGEDVDINLEDGSFSVESEDGTFSVDEDGNFTVEGADGETITGQADGDGNFTVEGADGETIVGESDGEGDFSMESEDGSFSVDSSGEIPESWPAEVPVPDDFDVGSASVIESPDGSLITANGTSSLDNEAFVAAYGAALESAGFDKLGEFSGDGSVSASYEGAEWSVAIAGTIGTSDNISISVFPNA
jgi:major membrane immunogen (membrane-anchored lipoprotein)